MPFIARAEVERRLRAQAATGKPIVGCGAGTGISAKMAEAGGCDLIIIYNSGRYRMAGRGSLAGLLAYGDANGIVVEMAVPMTLFFGVMFFVVLFIGSRLHFSYRDGVAVAFNSTGRDFEIAIAIAITAFSPTVALATVVGPLIRCR